MKILNISLDKNVVEKNSAVAKRMIEYGNLVDKFTVLVLADKNIEINLSDKVKVYSIKKSFCRIYNFLKLKKQTRKILKEEKYDVITVQDTYFVGWLSSKLARQFKVGLEIQVHGFEKFKGLRKLISRKILKNADMIRVVSQRLRKKLVDEFKVDGEKIMVVPIYTEVRKLESYKVKKSDDKFIFLTVGRLVPVKNIEMQIAVVQKLKSKKLKGRDIELWIIGDGIERNNLELRIKKLGLQNNIKFLGQQNDLKKFYSQADAFLLTSNSEGWGLAVVEAASFGLPIIMTDVGLAGEVIKNNESGIVIPVGDQKDLESAMMRLIENENLRKKLGTGALEEIKKLPNKEKTIKRMLNSWQKAMDNKK